MSPQRQIKAINIYYIGLEPKCGHGVDEPLQSGCIQIKSSVVLRPDSVVRPILGDPGNSWWNPPCSAELCIMLCFRVRMRPARDMIGSWSQQSAAVSVVSSSETCGGRNTKRSRRKRMGNSVSAALDLVWTSA